MLLQRSSSSSGRRIDGRSRALSGSSLSPRRSAWSLSPPSSVPSTLVLRIGVGHRSSGGAGSLHGGRPAPWGTSGLCWASGTLCVAPPRPIPTAVPIPPPNTPTRGTSSSSSGVRRRGLRGRSSASLRGIRFGCRRGVYVPRSQHYCWGPKVPIATAIGRRISRERSGPSVPPCHGAGLGGTSTKVADLGVPSRWVRHLWYLSPISLRGTLLRSDPSGALSRDHAQAAILCTSLLDR